MDTGKAIIIGALAAAAILAATWAVVERRIVVRASSGGYVYVINKWTGSIIVCHERLCEKTEVYD